jgi:hypothetical protein
LYPAPVPQASQQVADHRGILGGALGQGKRDLGAVDGDAQRDHAGVLSHPDAVEQQRDQVQAGQVGGQQLRQGVLGGGHEAAGDRRLRGARGSLGDLGADRFQPGWVAARRELGEHPLQRELVQQVGGGERLVGRHGQLSGATSGADPGPADPHPPAAEGHLARFGAMADRDAVGVVAALGADQPSDVLGEHGLEHLQARPNRQGQQTLAGGASQLSNRDRDLLG